MFTISQVASMIHANEMDIQALINSNNEFEPHIIRSDDNIKLNRDAINLLIMKIDNDFCVDARKQFLLSIGIMDIFKN